jgi:hypothetical protein
MNKSILIGLLLLLASCSRMTDDEVIAVTAKCREAGMAVHARPNVQLTGIHSAYCAGVAAHDD